MKFVISHYRDDYSWAKKYCDDFVVYHKDNVNVGYNISTMMSYIVENYEHLPEKVAFVKDNMLERHITKEEFEACLEKDGLVPLLTQNHKTDGTISRYADGLYYERNDGWYFNEYPTRYFTNYSDFALKMGLESPDYLGFAPGGCYIVPRESILKHPIEFYKDLLWYCSWSQINAESHAIERSLYNIWK